MAVSAVSFLLGLNVPGTGSVAMTSSATDVGTSPTTVRARIGGGQNALRVFTGAGLASERFFDVYVSKNGGAAQKVRMYRYLGRIFRGNPGDTFAFATSDGRTFNYAPLTAPANLTAPSGVTGTANCDKATPTFWSPSAAHVVLPVLGSRLQLNADGTERVVFISEQAPDGTWTPARHVWLPTATNVIVQCNYVNVAIANEAGATLSVTAPTGSTVGGASTTMSLPMPTITGTTHNVSTGAQLATAIAAAVAGDAIVGTGAVTLTGEVTAASFVANQAAGRKGYEGILIRGVTDGDRTSFVINGGGFGWTINMPGAGEQMTLYGYLKDLTFDWGANAKLGSHGGGKYRHQNVRVTGGTGDTWDFNATNYPIIVDALYCRVDTSGDDCWNLSGNATYNAASSLRFVCCDGVTGGNGSAASQCFTSHIGLAFEIEGGLWSDAHTNVIANDASSTPGYVRWARLSAGTRQSGVVNGVDLFGCVWTDSHSQTDIACGFSRVTTTLSGSTVTLFRNSMYLTNNVLAVGVGRAAFNSLGGALMIGNIGAGNETIRLGSAAGAVASTTVLFNTFQGGNIGFSSQDVSNMPSTFKNNASRTMTTSVNVVAGGGGAVTGDYNTLDATVSANYTPGANDTQPVDAALNTTSWFPTAAGNADGNGDPTVVDYIGDSDPWGFVRIYHSGRCSRGTRDNPGLYSGSGVVLYPDYI